MWWVILLFAVCVVVTGMGYLWLETERLRSYAAGLAEEAVAARAEAQQARYDAQRAEKTLNHLQVVHQQTLETLEDFGARLAKWEPKRVGGGRFAKKDAPAHHSV